MKKKLISLILSVVLVLVMCPMTAIAASNTLTINGQSFTSTQLASNQEGTGWKWKASKKTLILSGYNGSSINASIENLRIELLHGTTNTITVPTGVSENGITNDAATTIEGDGKLTIHGSDQLGTDGIYISAKLSLLNENDIIIDNVKNAGINANILSTDGCGRINIDSAKYGVVVGNSTPVVTDSTDADLFLGGSNELTINAQDMGIRFSLDKQIHFRVGNYSSISVYSQNESPLWFESTNTSNRIIISTESAPIVFSKGNAAKNTIGVKSGGEVTVERTGNPSQTDSAIGTSDISYDNTVLTVTPASLSGTSFTRAQLAVDSDHSAEGWKWDSANQKLILCGFNGETISAYGNLTIEMAAGTNNTINPTTTGNGIKDGGALTLIGSGNLSINHAVGSSPAISAAQKTIIDMSGKLSASKEYGMASALLMSSKSIYILGDGEIDFTAKTGPGIETTFGNVVFEGSGKTTITSLNDNAIYLGDFMGLGREVLLNASGATISLTAGGGEPAIKNTAGDSPVGGTHIDEYIYTVGSASSGSVVFRDQPEPTPTPDSPTGNDGTDVTGNAVDTGDHTNVGVWVALMAACMYVIGETVMWKKREEM